jgi:hypothetical protein
MKFTIITFQLVIPLSSTIWSLRILKTPYEDFSELLKYIVYKSATID